MLAAFIFAMKALFYCFRSPAYIHSSV